MGFERWVNESHTRSQIRKSRKLLGDLITMIQECFPRTDGWGWNLPKMHAFAKMPHYMLQFGSANNFSSHIVIPDWAVIRAKSSKEAIIMAKWLFLFLFFSFDENFFKFYFFSFSFWIATTLVNQLNRKREFLLFLKVFPKKLQVLRGNNEPLRISMYREVRLAFTCD